MARCFDCFHEFAADEDRFAVLKKLRELPADFQLDAAEARLIDSLAFDQVFVCGACAGWYGDHPIQLTAAEAGQ